MLEQPGDQHALAVADRIDVHLDPFEIPIDPNGAVRIHHRGRRQLPGEVVGRVAEVDRQPADDERRLTMIG